MSLSRILSYIEQAHIRRLDSGDVINRFVARQNVAEETTTATDVKNSDLRLGSTSRFFRQKNTIIEVGTHPLDS